MDNPSGRETHTVKTCAEYSGNFPEKTQGQYPTPVIKGFYFFSYSLIQVQSMKIQKFIGKFLNVF